MGMILGRHVVLEDSRHQTPSARHGVPPLLQRPNRRSLSPSRRTVELIYLFSHGEREKRKNSEMGAEDLPATGCGDESST